MASESGAPLERLDERLAAARDKCLLEGEKVIAEQEGDHGQAIVLTDRRVLIIKVGITATGVADGKVVGEFPLDRIRAVNVRKGPLGGVIQICTDEKPTLPGATPDNVIVFTGSKRMRACEAAAAGIAAAIGIPLGKTESPAEPSEGSVISKSDAAPQQACSLEPPPSDYSVAAIAEPAEEAAVDGESWVPERRVSEPPETSEVPVSRDRGGRRAARSLAEEIFEDMTRSTQQADGPPPQPEEPRSAEAPAVPAEQIEQAARDEGPTQPGQELRPNPNLPKPVRRHPARNRLVVLFGLLMAALLVGVAAVVPLRVVQEMPGPRVSSPRVVDNTDVLRRQHEAVTRYEAEVRAALDPANRALSAIELALTSGNKTALAAAVRTNAAESAWLKLERLAAPPGLASARQQIVSGLFAARTAAANLSVALQSSGVVDTRDSLARLAEAKSLIAKGLAFVEATRRDIERQMNLQQHTSSRRGPGGKEPRRP